MFLLFHYWFKYLHYGLFILLYGQLKTCLWVKRITFSLTDLYIWQNRLKWIPRCMYSRMNQECSDSSANMGCSVKHTHQHLAMFKTFSTYYLKLMCMMYIIVKFNDKDEHCYPNNLPDFQGPTCSRLCKCKHKFLAYQHNHLHSCHCHTDTHPFLQVQNTQLWSVYEQLIFDTLYFKHNWQLSCPYAIVM